MFCWHQCYMYRLNKRQVHIMTEGKEKPGRPVKPALPGLLWTTDIGVWIKNAVAPTEAETHFCQTRKATAKESDKTVDDGIGGTSSISGGQRFGAAKRLTATCLNGTATSALMTLFNISYFSYPRNAPIYVSPSDEFVPQGFHYGSGATMTGKKGTKVYLYILPISQPTIRNGNTRKLYGVLFGLFHSNCAVEFIVNLTFFPREAPPYVSDNRGHIVIIMW